MGGRSLPNICHLSPVPIHPAPPEAIMGTRAADRVSRWAMVLTLVTILAAASALHAAGKEITIIQSADVRGLDPSNLLGTEENVAYQIYDQLVWLTPDMKIDPKLAESWRNLDPLNWEIKLRKGVKFTNGEVYNADAVIESFKHMTRPQSQERARFQSWESISKVDDYTLRVKTVSSDPRFVTVLVSLLIMPPQVLKTDPNSLVDRPIGTGPFKLAEWVKGERIVLEANPDHWRGRPKLDRLVFKAIPEASARMAALQAGQADLILNVPPESVPLIERAANTKLIWVPSTRNMTIIFDQRSAPFNDVRVRQAMNYAVDKESINRNILGGRGLIQGTASHPSTFGHNAEIKPYPYDPQKAKQLLTQAGYPNGFETDFGHPTGRWVKDVEVTQAVAGMLEKVGVRTKLHTGEYNGWFANWAKGSYKGMSMIGTLSQIDADRTVFIFMHSTKGTYLPNTPMAATARGIRSRPGAVAVPVLSAEPLRGEQEADLGGSGQRAADHVRSRLAVVVTT
jgi:peptide/nickel transport system substrate-binding protein